MTTITDEKSVKDFLKNKKITCTNHLISGAPTSIILSYLVNNKMFNELNDLSTSYSILMSIYVDDLTFSSLKPIPKEFRKAVKKIINRYNYKLSIKKIKLYKKHQHKLVTGVIITPDNKVIVKNSLRRKVIKQFMKVKISPNSKNIKVLQGLVSSARQIDKSIFPSIYNYAYKSNLDINQSKTHNKQKGA